VGDYHIRQLILRPRILVAWVCWGLKPEVLVSLFVKASAIWVGGSLRLNASVIGEAGRAPFQLCRGIRLTTEGKHGELSLCRGAATELLVATTGLSFEGQPQLVCWTSFHFGYPSGLGRHRCLPSCRTKGFPASANFESKLSVNALMWSVKNEIPKSS
jgi:hypothetical protein